MARERARAADGLGAARAPRARVPGRLNIFGRRDLTPPPQSDTGAWLRCTTAVRRGDRGVPHHEQGVVQRGQVVWGAAAARGPQRCDRAAGNKADLGQAQGRDRGGDDVRGGEQHPAHGDLGQERDERRHLFQEIVGARARARPRPPPRSRRASRVARAGDRSLAAVAAPPRAARMLPKNPPQPEREPFPSSRPRAGRRSRAAHSRDARRRMASYDTAIRFCRAAVCSRALSSWCAHRCTGVGEGFCC